jgi:uncharacterized protein YlxP (DUF503 family)
MNVGALEIRIVVRGAHSLKEKRRVVKSLKDRLRNRFNVAVAEVDDLDHRQAATLGVVSVGNDAKYLVGQLEKVSSFVRGHPEADVVDAHIEMR